MTLPADFDVSSQTTETAAVAAIRELSAVCFLNLLSRDCDTAVAQVTRPVAECDESDREGFSIDPLIGSIQRRPDPTGVQFSMLGRLKTGRVQEFDVRVHGVNTPEGVAFISIERAYDRQGRPGPTFYEAQALAA
jgi:hypothetical protein